MPVERSVRTRLITAMVLLLVLVAGMVLGVALERRLEARAVSAEDFREDREERIDREREERDRRPGDRSRDPSPRRRSLLVEQVGLTEDQKEKVDSIVGYYRERMRTLHEEFDAVYSSRYAEILDSTRSAIRGVLDESQRAAYDSLLMEFDSRMEQRRRDSIGDWGDDRNGR